MGKNRFEPFVSDRDYDIRGSHGWPTCAVCNRPVQFMTAERSPLHDEWIITVTCHGEKESVTVPAREILLGDGPPRIRLDGFAFVQSTKELPLNATPTFPPTGDHGSPRALPDPEDPAV